MAPPDIRKPLTVAPWTPAKRRAEPEPDTDPGGATSPDFHVHLPRRVTGKQVAAIVTSLVALLGSGWYAKEKLAVEPQVVMVSSAWKDDVMARLSSLEKRFEGVLSEVRDNTAAVRTQTLVSLSRDRWLARQAGDHDEARRIQDQIDQLEGRKR